jgi:tetratricopeptide (TPR) repeat protein
MRYEKLKVLLDKAHTASVADDYDEAIRLYTDAIALDPNEIRAYWHRSTAYHAKDDFDCEIADLDQTIRLDPTDDIFYLLRGSAYGDKGDYDQAIADFEHTLKLDPDYEAAKEGLVEAQRKRGAQEGNA